MRYGNRTIWRRFVTSPITMIVVFIVLIVLIKASLNVYGKAKSGAIRLDRAKAEFDRLDNRYVELADRVSSLSTEDGLETQIRTKFHAVKEGESVAVIVNSPNTASPVDAQQIHATSSIGWWSRLLRIFGF